MNWPNMTTSHAHANAGPAKEKPSPAVWNMPVRIEM